MHSLKPRMQHELQDACGLQKMSSVAQESATQPEPNHAHVKGLDRLCEDGGVWAVL
jgi:hypothetical protein